MSTFTRLYYHIVFGTKYRKPSLKESFRARLYQYVGGVLRTGKGTLLEIGGVDDHVHLLANVSPATSVSDSIRNIKANASRWINEEIKPARRFEWQKGYSAFTVSHSQISSVRTYLQNQSEHHRKLSFREEYIELLRRHGIPFEEKYLFEEERHG